MLDLRKPARGSGRLARHLRKLLARRQIRKAQHAEKLARIKQWNLTRTQVFARDGGLCRICGLTLRIDVPDPRRAAHIHHVIYRSAGGTDLPENLCVLCPLCHEAEHMHRIELVGNADDLLTLTTFDRHGEILSVRQV